MDSDVKADTFCTHIYKIGDNLTNWLKIITKLSRSGVHQGMSVIICNNLKNKTFCTFVTVTSNLVVNFFY